MIVFFFCFCKFRDRWIESLCLIPVFFRFNFHHKVKNWKYTFYFCNMSVYCACCMYLDCVVIFFWEKGAELPSQNCERTNSEKCKHKKNAEMREKNAFLSWPFNIDLHRRWNDNIYIYISNLLFKPSAHYIRKDAEGKIKRSKRNETKRNKADKNI